MQVADVAVESGVQGGVAFEGHGLDANEETVPCQGVLLGGFGDGLGWRP